MKTVNHKGWFFVIPVVILVAFNALVPMMTVVNYSVQETFGNNVFFWQGLGWFEQILRSDRFQAALGRQFMFTGIILAIEVPLGIFVALSMPRKGFWVPVCLVLMALPIGLFVATYSMNPDYVMLLFTDELGRKMIAGAVVIRPPCLGSRRGG